MKKSRADTGVKHLPTNCEGHVPGCHDWQELLELSPGSTTPGYNGKRATTYWTEETVTLLTLTFSTFIIFVYLIKNSFTLAGPRTKLYSNVFTYTF